LREWRGLRKLGGMNASIRHIFISPGHNYNGHHGVPPSEHASVEVAEVRCLAGRGLEGDRFLDFKPDFKGQVTFFAWETYVSLCAQFGIVGKSVAVFRRNVITEGLDLPSLVGVEFELQGVRFLGTQESAPCHWMNDAFCPGAEAAMSGRGGLRAKILSDGVLRAGGAAG
jgi:MOSC domain-containing protein YiiM